MSRPLLPNILLKAEGVTDPQLQDVGAQPQQQQLQQVQQQQQLPLAPQHEFPMPTQQTSAGNATGLTSASNKVYAKRGKITIVACVPCRRRKTKCDGQRPACSQCIARNGQCLYDMTDEQRKLTYLRDSVEHLQERSNNLEGLLYTVQNASEEEAVEIFRRLRSGTDVLYVAEQVQAGRMLSGVGRQDYVPSQQAISSSSVRALPVQRVQQYDTLVKTIAEADTSTCDDIIRRLRSREDVSSIVYSAQTGALAAQTLVTASSTASPGLESDYSRQDQTFGLVKGAEWNGTHASTGFGSEFATSHTGQPWTSVTQDRDLIEHLLTSYFTWQHSFFQNFPEALFRSDMGTGRTKFCSSSLVNAICAAGCFLSARGELHTDLGDGYTMVDRFYDEAVRLLPSSSAPSVTTTAALYLLSYVEGTRGRLSNLWMFSGRSALMALDINLHLRQDVHNKTGSDEEEKEIKNEQKARTHAFWGCFHVDQITSFTLGKVPIININSVTVPLPEVEPETDEEPWEATGLTLPSRPGCRATTFQQCSALTRIVNSTLLMFFAPSVPLTGALLLEEHQKYLYWKDQLPENVADLTNATPHVLCLHMYYHSAVLLLFRPFLKATIAGSDLVPREICRQAANAISDTWSQHYSIFEYSGIYMFQVHCLLTACTIHIVNLPSIAASSYLTTACNYLQHLVSRNEWARSSLNILRGLVDKWSLILPQDVEEALFRGAKDTESSQIDPALSSMGTNYIWPKGPDAATQHHSVTGIAPVAGSTLTPAVGQLISSLVPGPRLKPAGTGAKRTHGRASASSLSGEAAQKRQRLAPPRTQPGRGAQQNGQQRQPDEMQKEAGQADAIDANGDDAEDDDDEGRSLRSLGSGSEQQPLSATSYLYAPLDAQGQTGPLLAPVHSSSKPRASKATTTAGAAAAATASAAVAAAEAAAASAAATSSPAVDFGGQSTAADDGAGTDERIDKPSGSGTGTGPGPGTSASAGAGSAGSRQGTGTGTPAPTTTMTTRRTRAGKRRDEIQGVQNGVEGMSFEDDWRDPFMGFFSEEQ